MPGSFEENAPQTQEHFCARCLRPVAQDALECDHCSRRFVGRGRFDRLSGVPPTLESLRLMPPGVRDSGRAACAGSGLM